MNRSLPRAEDLNLEEIDYELSIRNQPEEVFKLDVQGKQRHLRLLFKSDQKEGRNYRSNTNIQDEAGHISARIDNLEKALSKKVEAKYESRVIHYYYRVKRCIADTEEGKELRRELSRRIEKLMQYYQFGPSLSPFKEPSIPIIQETEGAVGLSGPVSPSRTMGEPASDSMLETGPKGRCEMSNSQGTIPKVNRSDFRLQERTDQNGIKDTIEVSRTEWEELKRILADLSNKANADNAANMVSRPRIPENRQTFPQNNPRTQQRQTGLRSTCYADEFVDTDSDEEEFATVQQNRLDRRVDRNQFERDSYEDSLYEYDSGSTRRYRHRRGIRDGRHRREQGYGRVEKWKLRFSGDSRGISVENFLYKASKLAEREGVSEHTLLRDIHMLLEGAASDWFFTYVDDLITWEDFKNGITYRFGNPNKDQGIRSKIQERKQQRGESFIAFVSEIEKLNRMLSKPLSRRRKFEVIWDNMRQHYRSKISIVRVRDLQHLIDLNYRIDAADHQLHQPGVDHFVRRPINQIEAAEYVSEDEEEQEATVNHVKGQYQRNRPPASRPFSGPTQQVQGNRQAENGEPGLARLSCWNCQEEGHGWRQCTKPRNIFCYGCGNLGRTIRSCERCVRQEVVPESGIQGNLRRGASQGN